MSIQGYGLFNDGGLYPMREGGDWVRNDDHKAALVEKEAELEKYRDLLRSAQDVMEQVGIDTEKAHAEIQELLGSK